MNSHDFWVHFFTLTLAMTVSACSQVPYPVTYPISEQRKMQAAAHWQILAQDVAMSIEQQIDKKQPLSFLPPGKEPFNVLLTDFLEEELVLKGYPIVSSPTQNSLPISIKSKVLEHSNRELRRPPGKLTALASGIWVLKEIALSDPISALAAGTIGGAVALDATDGVTTDLPRREVIVSVKIMKDNSLLFTQNNIYYINDDESWQYDTTPYINTPEQREIKTKKLSISGK